MFDPKYTVTVTSDDIHEAYKLSAEIIAHTGGDRSNPNADEDISPHGIAGEIGNIRLFSRIIGVCEEEKLRLWKSLRVHSSNYGIDIPAIVFGLPLPIETKTTKHYSDNTGCLYMRCRSGDWYECSLSRKRHHEDLMLQYWKSVLPESYYILLIDRFPTFHFVCWATRRWLLANYSSWRLNDKMPSGLPTIGLIHTIGFKPDTMAQKLKSLGVQSLA